MGPNANSFAPPDRAEPGTWRITTKPRARLQAGAFAPLKTRASQREALMPERRWTVGSRGRSVRNAAPVLDYQSWQFPGPYAVIQRCAYELGMPKYAYTFPASLE